MERRRHHAHCTHGATGHLGSHLLNALLDTGVPDEEIIAIVRDTPKARSLSARGIVVRQADYTEPRGWVEALQDVDRLLLISVSGAGTSAAHRTVIDVAKEVGVSRLLYTSILQAQTTSNPLAPEHAATEHLIEASGIPHTFLRNAWYHEVYTRLLPQYLESGEIVGSTDAGRISGAARQDFGAAAAAILRSEDTSNQIYELGGPSFTLADLAATVTGVSARRVTHRNLTEAQHRALMP